MAVKMEWEALYSIASCDNSAIKILLVEFFYWLSMQLAINLCSFNKWTYLLSSQMKRTRWMDTDLFCLNWKSKQGKVESCWQAVSQLQRSGVGTYLPFWWPEASLHSSGHRNYKVVTHPASSLVQCKWKFAGLDRWSTHRATG